MAVVQATFWEPKPGRAQEVIGHMTTAKKIHERLGARVRARQVLIAGPTPPQLQYLMQFDDIVAWSEFSQKLQTDQEWQKFVQDVVGAADPSATLVSNNLAQEIPGLEGARTAPAAGTFSSTFQWRPKPGRMAEVIEANQEAKKLVEKVGGRLRALQVLVAGPNTGNVVTAVEYDDVTAYGKAIQQLQADADFQAFAAKRLQGENPAAEPLGSSLLVELPI